jgi:DNA-binding LytR/AlgR family response regulator
MNNEIVLKTGRTEYEIINKKEIKIIKTSQNYSTIEFINDKQAITICKSMKKLLKENNFENFIKIRRGIIINTDVIQKLNLGNKPIIILKNGENYTPSRRCLKELKNKVHKSNKNNHSSR